MTENKRGVNKKMKKDELLYKSEGVMDCVKWLEKKIKEEQATLEKTDWYYILEAKGEQKAIIRELISVKISLEKYSKKLKHEANELES